MKFLRNLLASILGTFIAFGIIFLLLLVSVAALTEAKQKTVKENSVLEISLAHKVKDYAPKSSDPLNEILGIYDHTLGLNEILNAIENAKYDDNIKGISISTAGVFAGMSQVETIRKKLEDFKNSGKFINSYADIYNQKAYYLSSVADSVYINPMGFIEFGGLSSELLFFKDLQDKTGVQMEVIRHGKYKSAVEPFLSNEMSSENREQISSLLNTVWNQILTDISNSRKITIAELSNIADNLLGRNAQLAVENMLVDAAIYLDEYEDRLKEAVGISLEKNLNLISLEDYIESGKGRIITAATEKIAVIFAQGEIIYGKGNEDFIGQDLMINTLRKARKDSSVKAIVLRINSPGGSALASELIWREIELTKEVLPVIVSMGDVAASGGYYIACNADKIFTEPTSITGSIGVFGVLPNLNELADKIGINAEQVKTNNSASYSLFEPMSDAFRNVTQEGVGLVYETFLSRVSQGRNLTIQRVDSIAQGRVWSGTDAVKNGLADELGGLEDAIEYAAQLVELDSYRVRNYPDYKIDLRDRINRFPLVKSKEDLLIEEFGEENYKVYNSIKQLSKIKGMQARLPFIMEIK